MQDQIASTTGGLAPGHRSTAPAGSAGADVAVGRLVSLIRYLDVAFVVAVAPIAIALGAPVFGCALGALAWLGQRVLAQTDRRWIRAREPRKQLGLNIAEAFGRIWLLAGAIVVAGAVGDRADGLAAALMIFAVYSVAFAMRLSKGRRGFEL